VFAAIAVSSLGLGFGVAAGIAAATAVIAAFVLPSGLIGGGDVNFVH
jgi:hypothetical protein